MPNEQRSRIQKALVELFSGYRAEWLAGDVFSLFTEPSYFPQLTTAHPSLLVGGRGTGKTTALRSLSYLGQRAIRPDTAVGEWPFYGFYYRVNTNRVNAFSGPELTDSKWSQLFGHYVNLEFCELVLRFLEWFGTAVPGAPGLSHEALARFALTLQLGDVTSLTDLTRRLEVARIKFEAAINNIADNGPMPPLSLQGAPIDQLFRDLKALPQFSGKTFFFLVDEYENFDRLQQRVVNTLIKHCGELYSFKIGVKEFGLRERSTLNAHEQLIHPADYKIIPITDDLSAEKRERFAGFAATVCNLRLQRATAVEDSTPDIRKLFPGLEAEEEAMLLGVSSLASEALAVLDDTSPSEIATFIRGLSPLELYVLSSRAKADGVSLIETATQATTNHQQWKEHYDNYKHAYLFTLKRGKGGIRKYYCGWDVMCILAAGNIRFLLELVDQALTRHIADDRDPSSPVSPENQTKAAHDTGSKNLRELEGLALSGGKLTRLLLGLGRVFQVMAEDPIGHTPEVNQFSLTTERTEARAKVDELLVEGVMHLALVRYPGSKLQEASDIRQWDYAIHPIYSPFFGFSHRRKRKIALSDDELLALVEKPRHTIRQILSGQNRTLGDDLPEQMQLFADYYAIQTR